MLFTAETLPEALRLGAQWGFWALVLWAAWGAAWRWLLGRRLLGAWLASGALLLALWQLRVESAAGVALHLSGATLLTLMFGWRLALLALAALLAIGAATGLAPAGNLGVNGLVEAAAPVAASYLCARAVERLLPAHFFVYVFVSAFLGGAIGVLARALPGAWLLGLEGVSNAHDRFEAVTGCLLTLFPEAFMTGAAITLMVVYRPSLVVSFDDERYLRGR